MNGRHLGKIAQQIALGQRRLLERRVGGPVHSIQVAELDRVRPDRDRAVRLDPLKLTQHVVDLRLRKRIWRSTVPCASRRTLRASMSSRSRRKTGARSEPSSVQPWNFTSTTAFGSTQVVGAFISGLSANGQVLRSSGGAARDKGQERSSNPRPDVRCVPRASFLPSSRRAVRRAARALLAFRVAAHHEVRAARRLDLEP